MIAWLVLIGGLLLLLTVPTRLFGWCCGLVVRVLVRDRKPPLPPPI